jgi:phage shock protein A
MDEAKETSADTIANDPDIEDELKEEKKPRKKWVKK